MALPNYIRQETNLTGEIVNANVAAAGLEIQVAFVDKKTGEARTPQDTTLQFVINKDNSKFEIIRAESHVTADGVTTITVKADGRKIPSFGSGSGGAIGNSHNIGDSVSCVYTADQVNNIIEVLEGNFATGASELKLGTEANGDITITFENGEANKPFLKWDQAQSKLLFSNNGVDVLAIGTGGGDIQSGEGTTVDGGVLNINLGDENTFTTDGGAGNEGLAVVTNENGLIDPSLLPYEFITEPSGNDDTGKAVLLNDNDQIDSAFIPPVTQEQTETMYPVFGECTNLVQNNGGIGSRTLPVGDLVRPIPCYAYGKRVLNMIAYGNGVIAGNNAAPGSNTGGSKPFKLTTKGAYVPGSIPASNNIIDPNFVAIRIDLGAGESLKINITGALCSILRNVSGDGKDKSLKIVGKTVDNAPDLNNVKFTLDNIVCYSSPTGTYTTTNQTLTVENGDFFIFSTTNSGGVRQLTNESIPAQGTGSVFTASDGVNFSEPDPNTISSVKFPNIHLLVEILGNKYGDFSDSTKQFVQVGFYETAENAKGSATNIMSLNHVGFITRVNNDGSFEVTQSKIINHADVTEIGAYYTVSGYNISKLPDTAVMFDDPRNRRIIVGRCIKPGVLEVDHRAVQFVNIGRYTTIPGEDYPNIAFISSDDKTSVFYRRYILSEVTSDVRNGNQRRIVDAFPYPVYGRPKSIVRFGNKSSTDEYGNVADEQNAIYPLMAPKVIDRDFDIVYFSIADNGFYVTPNQQTQDEDALSGYAEAYLIEY